MKKTKKWLKWLILGIVLVPVAGIGIVFAQIPKQEKLVCEFDDGDQIIIRQDYTFQLMGYIAKPVPVKNYAGKMPDVFYKPRNGVEEQKPFTGRDSIGPAFGKDKVSENWRRTYCSDYRKLDGAISARGKYRLPGADWNSASWSSELWDLRHEKDLFRGNGATFSKINSSSLLLEAPLITYENSLKTVQAVFRSYSHDGGQTWTPLELTKDSKLYELGKPVYEQKGVARPVDWTGKP